MELYDRRLEKGYVVLGLSSENKSFIWLMVENKILTWEILQRRGFIGPSICMLCKKHEESTQHLFMECSFTVEVWRKLKNSINYSGNWAGNNLMECFKQWKVLNFPFQTLPALICWFIWREQNQVIFEDSDPSVQKVIHLSLMTMREHKFMSKVTARRSGLSQSVVGGMVGWFDGATTSSGLNSGAGGVIRINEQCCYKWFLNCGSGTNTRAELLGAWALLSLASRLSIQEIHVLGDSKIIIDWLRGKGRLQVITLDCWKDRLTALINHFHKISFAHVYRDDNKVVDSLSKQALNRDPGKLIYFQCVEEHEGPHMFLDLY
jgi:ribonuclease HI